MHPKDIGQYLAAQYFFDLSLDDVEIMYRISLICALLALCLVSCKSQDDSLAANQPQSILWEYKVVKLTDLSPEQHMLTINEYGAQGWELVNTHSNIGTSVNVIQYGREHINVRTTAMNYVFKRPRANAPEVVAE